MRESERYLQLQQEKSAAFAGGIGTTANFFVACQQAKEQGRISSFEYAMLTNQGFDRAVFPPQTRIETRKQQ